MFQVNVSQVFIIGGVSITQDSGCPFVYSFYLSVCLLRYASNTDLLKKNLKIQGRQKIKK